MKTHQNQEHVCFFMKFLDEAKIFLKSGDGGDGCVSFRREKFVPDGGPDGAPGGKGGDIIFKTNPHLNTLIDFRYTQHFKASKGENGKGRDRFGASGHSLVIDVPKGTQIFSHDKKTLLHDFLSDNEEVRFLKGGRGGMGNAHFKSSTNRAPKFAQKGEKGQESWVWLRLKLIADIGLVGFPNIGKSTFLSKVSAAKPKIADYPFTTLHPHLGVVKTKARSFVLADIPGLIEGAHEGRGLGHRFLGHIERCKALLIIGDATSNTLLEDYQSVMNELSCYSPYLEHKEKIVALSRIDLISGDELKTKLEFLKNHKAFQGQKIYPFSSFSKVGLKILLDALVEKLSSKSETL